MQVSWEPFEPFASYRVPAKLREFMQMFSKMADWQEEAGLSSLAGLRREQGKFKHAGIILHIAVFLVSTQHLVHEVTNSFPSPLEMDNADKNEYSKPLTILYG